MDPEVAALYQRGVQAYDTRTPAGVADAVSAFSDAIERDSSFAPAWNALAKAYARAYQRGFQVPGVPFDQLLPLAVTAVNRSLATDSTNADAWMTHGVVMQQVDPVDLGPALQSIRRSLALDSTQAPAWHYLAIMTADSGGDVGAAQDFWRKSVSLAPRYSQGLAFMALSHYWRGAYDSAAFWADSAVSVDPTYLLGRQSAALIAIEREQFDEAERQAEAAFRLSSEVERVNSTANQALVKARRGQRNMAMVDLLGAEVVSGGFKPTPPHTAVYLAEAQAALGDVPKAIRSLGLYATPRDGHFQLHLRCSPTFAPLENDSTFRALLIRPRPVAGAHC